MTSNTSPSGPNEAPRVIQYGDRIVIQAADKPVTFFLEVESVRFGSVSIDGTTMTYTPANFPARDESAEFGLVALVSIGTVGAALAFLLTLIGGLDSGTGVLTGVMFIVVAVWAAATSAGKKARSDKLKAKAAVEETNGDH